MRPFSPVHVAACIVAGVALSAGVAAAQTKPARRPGQKPAPQKVEPLPSRPAVIPVSREPGRPGSFEIAAAAHWLGAGNAGTGTATLTPNQAGGAGQGFTWFRANGEYQPSAGVRATFAYNLSRTLSAEAGFTYSASRIRYIVSDDPELSSGFTSPGQRLSEYFVDGAVVVRLKRLAFAHGRGRPFALAGGGYLRQLHAGRALVETGQVYYAGGGVKYLLSPWGRGLVRAFGLRLDARACVRSGGFGFSDGATISPAASAGIVAAF